MSRDGQWSKAALVRLLGGARLLGLDDLMPLCFDDLDDVRRAAAAPSKLCGRSTRAPDGRRRRAPIYAGEKAWDSLSLYESSELVRRLTKEATSRRPVAAKAREISAHFSQAREYFRSVAGVGELVKPLIFKYGAVALARGHALPRSEQV